MLFKLEEYVKLQSEVGRTSLLIGTCDSPHLACSLDVYKLMGKAWSAYVTYWEWLVNVASEVETYTNELYRGNSNG